MLIDIAHTIAIDAVTSVMIAMVITIIVVFIQIAHTAGTLSDWRRMWLSIFNIVPHKIGI